MDKTKQFAAEQKQHIDNTLSLMDATDRRDPGASDIIALATMANNIYTGMENILRNILSAKGIKVAKSGTWHKDILSAAVNNNIVSDELRIRLLSFLAFRHFHVHGYGYMIDWKLLKPLVEDAPGVAKTFFVELTHNGYL